MSLRELFGEIVQAQTALRAELRNAPVVELCNDCVEPIDRCRCDGSFCADCGDALPGGATGEPEWCYACKAQTRDRRREVH